MAAILQRSGPAGRRILGGLNVLTACVQNCLFMSRVLNVILSHKRASSVRRMLAWWEQYVPRNSILLVHGGERAEFERVDHGQKLLLDDLRLKTRDHQREFQSYTKLFQAAANWLESASRDFEFVHFAEYDHLPLITDLNQQQITRLDAEGADIMGFRVQRVDGTSYPHYLYHVTNPNFGAYWSRISRRREPEVVLSMFGSGSFWTREAFSTVAGFEEPFPMYMEIYLPTLAHHLGLRLRDFAEQNKFVHHLGDWKSRIDLARRAGNWTLHPVKEL